MPSELPRFTIRVSPDLIKKMGYIAEESGRSINKEIEQLIKAHIAAYEKKNGPINID
ncbi:MAG: Arc family DNA-binding protein [Desulfosporosinus sp.]|nr:Arc family DNA-binding protein [Desulfosporosinus sp.]